MLHGELFWDAANCGRRHLLRPGGISAVFRQCRDGQTRDRRLGLNRHPAPKPGQQNSPGCRACHDPRAAGGRFFRLLLRPAFRSGKGGAKHSGKLACGRITRFRRFCQAAQDSVFNGGSKVASVEAQRRRLGKNLAVHDRKLRLGAGVGGAERRRRSQSKVSNGRQGIHVAPVTDRLVAMHLLRTGVLNRAENVPHDRQRQVVVGAGDAEVRQLGRAAPGQDNVGRLDVPVHHPKRMNAVQGGGNFFHNLNRPRRRQPPVCSDPRFQSRAGNVFHDQCRRIVSCRIILRRSAGMERI